MHQHILKAWVSGNLSNTVLEIFCPSYLYWLLFLLIGYFNELLLFNEQYFKISIAWLPTVFKWENVLEELVHSHPHVMIPNQVTQKNDDIL